MNFLRPIYCIFFSVFCGLVVGCNSVLIYSVDYEPIPLGLSCRPMNDVGLTAGTNGVVELQLQCWVWNMWGRPVQIFTTPSAWALLISTGTNCITNADLEVVHLPNTEKITLPVHHASMHDKPLIENSKKNTIHSFRMHVPIDSAYIESEEFVILRVQFIGYSKSQKPIAAIAQTVIPLDDYRNRKR